MIWYQHVALLPDWFHKSYVIRNRYPQLRAMNRLRIILFWTASCLVSAVWMHAHPAGLTAARITINADGQCTVQLTFDVLAAALNDLPERISDDAMRQLLRGPRSELERRLEAARRRMERQLELRSDGVEQTLTLVGFPTAGEILEESQPNDRLRLPLLMRAEFRTVLCRGKHNVQIAFPEVIGSVVLSIETSDREPFSEPLAGGQWSASFPVAIAEASLLVDTHNRSNPTGRPEDQGQASVTSAGDGWSQFGAYLRLGYNHILPRGLDHILFVIGLLLFARSWRALLGQVTAFTVAHTVTLGLAMYGVVRVPGTIVEPLIALSIAAVALDNVLAHRVGAWRVGLIFIFGLVHGLGFAGALQELGLARAEFPRALFGFNLGVELGQLTIVAIGWAALAWLRPRPQYRAWCAVPASICIGLVAVGWTIARLW